MVRLAGGGLIGFLLIALWIYCVVRSLPKPAWLLIVIVLPTVGSIAWLALGRPVLAGWRPGDTTGRRTRPVVGPEDRPDFPTTSSAAEQARLRHLGRGPRAAGAGAPSGEARGPAVADDVVMPRLGDDIRSLLSRWCAVVPSGMAPSDRRSLANGGSRAAMEAWDGSLMGPTG